MVFIVALGIVPQKSVVNSIVKALIGFKAFYFLGLVLVRFWCICEMGLYSTCLMTTSIGTLVAFSCMIAIPCVVM